MARDLGLSNVPLNWAFEGKMDSVDLNKIKKTMVSYDARRRGAYV